MALAARGTGHSLDRGAGLVSRVAGTGTRLRLGGKRAVAASRLGLGLAAIGALGDGTRLRVLGGIDLGKVGAGQTSVVGIVNNKRKVAKVGRVARLQRGIRVGKLSREGIRGNLAILAAEVTDLAGGRLGGIARGLIAAVGGIQVAESRGAVAVGGGLGVDMID